jgi:hypothetical protein
LPSSRNRHRGEIYRSSHGRGGVAERIHE